MTKQQAIYKAIDLIKGKEVQKGAVIGHKSDEMTYEFVRYEGTKAICEFDGKIKKFPKDEIFDVNKLINVANHLLNVGFWQEGMESFVVKNTKKII